MRELSLFRREALFEKRLAEDLQLDRLAELITPDRIFRLSVQELSFYFTIDPVEIAARQAAMRDMVGSEGLCSDCLSLLEAIEIWTAHTGILRQEQTPGAPNLTEYVFVENFRKSIGQLAERFAARKSARHSNWMQVLAEELHDLQDSPEMRRIAENYAALTPGAAVAGRIILGVDLGEDLEPRECKLLSLEEGPGSRKKTPLQGAKAVTAGTLASQAAGRGSAEIGSFVRRLTGQIVRLKSDLTLLLTGAALARRLQAEGLPCCFAEIRPTEEKAFAAEQLANPLLLAAGSRDIVSSSIAFEPEGELLLLTGANQGGKTTFLQSVGIAQWLFQLGLPIAAASAAISPCRSIVTVFASREKTGSGKSLLAEELSRIGEAIRETRADSLLLLNEPLNATSPAENLSISQEVLTALSAARVRGIWVTHFYELAAERQQIALDGGAKLGSIRVEVEPTEEGYDPSYRVLRGEPEGNSYAGEVLRRKGVKR